MEQELIIPVITPIKEDGSVDKRSILRLVDFINSNGCDGIFIGGSTGEFAGMPDTLKLEAIKAFAEVSNGVKFAIGVSDVSYKRIHEFVQMVKKAIPIEKVSFFVCTLPMYFSIPDKEQVSFFKSVASEIGRPIVLYNIPQMTNNKYITHDALMELRQNEQIIGLKESSKNFLYYQSIVNNILSKDFKIYQGAEEFMAVSKYVGSSGFVPGIANAIPKTCSQLSKTADLKKALEIQKVVLSVMEIYKFAPWIIALKVILKHLGIISSTKSFVYDGVKPNVEKKIINVFEMAIDEYSS